MTKPVFVPARVRPPVATRVARPALVTDAPRLTRCSAAVLAALGLLAGGDAAWAQARPARPIEASAVPKLTDIRNSQGIGAVTTGTYNAPGRGPGLQTTIEQLAPKAIINWEQLNLGRDSKLQFVQPSATAAVLNRIHSQDPSVIQGLLQGNGQVYLINQNGIFFDRGSRVDVNTLVASSLNMTDEAFKAGLTSGSRTGAATFQGRTDGSLARQGMVIIGDDDGGQLAGAAAATLTAQKGGAIVVIAPGIDNRGGLISAPDGQVILAAGRKAWLAIDPKPDFQMRGMLVEVAAGNEDVNLSSLIRNSGVLSAEHGNVTLAALAINHSGRISASSALQANGSVYLQARNNNLLANNEFDNATRGEAPRAGTVTLAAGSVVETPLDLNDRATLREADSYRDSRSRVRIEGGQIVHQGVITAPAGEITLTAADTVNPGQARIYLDRGSVIDAAGVWSEASNAENLLTFKVTSNELKDSPDQRNGVLRGATVTVDLREGSTLLDLSGYQENRQRTLAQKAAVGGDVNLNSSGSLIQRQGSAVNVAGGGVRYVGSREETTQLIGADGRTYDITNAPQTQTYTAIANRAAVDFERWGYTQAYDGATFGAGTVRPDYLQGAAGGNVAIRMAGSASGVVLDGRFVAGSTVGSQQRDAAPSGGRFTLGFGNGSEGAQDFGVGNITFVASGAAPTLDAGFGADSALSAADRATLRLAANALLSPDQPVGSDAVVGRGFGVVDLHANGTITVPAGVTVNGPLGGELDLSANRVQIDGTLHLPGGTVRASGLLTNLSAAAAAAGTPEQSVQLGAGGVIDVRGSWTNAFLAAATSLRPTGDAGADATVASDDRRYLDGGSVDITATRVDLLAGGLIDVAAGGAVSTRGALTGGNAGTLTIAATGLDTATAPALTLASRVDGHGFNSGGTFNLSADSLAGVDGGLAGVFAPRGFQTLTVTTQGDLALAAGQTLQPRLETLQFDGARALGLASDGRAADAARLVTLGDDQRKAVNIGLSSGGGSLNLATGSRIDADPLARVTLAGKTGVAIDGQVRSAGGAITVRVDGVDEAAELPALVLGEHGVLDTAGRFIARPNAQGQVQGNLLAGGSVTLSASKAALELRAGSLIDVSGSQQAIDRAAPANAALITERVTVASNAGTVTVNANDQATLAGELRGRATGSAAGGSLAINYTERGDAADTDSTRRIVLDRQRAAPADSPVTPAVKNLVLSGEALAAGGFDKLRLRAEDEIAFVGDQTLAFARGLTLDTKRLAVGDGADVLLQGASVKLANTFGERVENGQSGRDRRRNEDPTQASARQVTTLGADAGTLTARADTLDVLGSVTVSGARQTTLVAAHDLRLSGRAVAGGAAGGSALVGALVTPGNLTLQAAQVYPTTASSFTVQVADGLSRVATPGGRLTVEPGQGAVGAVFSAGGRLLLQADEIVQNGRVKAPLGSLELKAGAALTLGAGSVTSVSAEGLTVPYGQTEDGVTWTYATTGYRPVTNPGQVLSQAPSKRLTLDGPTVDVQAGAVIDVSGGGDVAAIEFVPGSGGSRNVLAQPNTYAIVPVAQLSAMPIDPNLAGVQNLGFDRDANVYNSVRIGPGGAVPAGEYVLLPGYYGLMPGGYMVELLTGSTYANLRPGQTARLPNGLTVLPGVMGVVGTGVSASQSIGVVVRPGSDIPKLALYNVTGSDYFAGLAQRERRAVPQLPGDGGQLLIKAGERLALDGVLRAAPGAAGARSAQVDLSALEIALVDRTDRTDLAPGTLQIEAASLSRLNASVLIGGERSDTGSGVTVTPNANHVTVANGADTELSSPELILVANDRIDVRAGSRIASSGSGGDVAQDLTLAGGQAGQGALLRVAASDAVAIKRPAQTGAASRGTVAIEAGAVIASARALQLDATLNTVSQGQLDVAAGGALSLASGRVSMGETAGLSADGLVLDNAQLAGFNTLGSLSIQSYGGIDLYGQTTLGSAQLRQLTLDGAGLSGRASLAEPGAAPNATLQAGAVALINSSGARATVDTATPPGTGTLAIRAGEVTLGAGDKRLDGYGSVQVSATGDIVASGTGSLTSGAALQLSAAQVRSTSGANQRWTAVDDRDPAAPVYQAVRIDSPDGAPVSAAAAAAANGALGSRLSVTGSDIAGNGRVVMKSGRIALEALGSGPGEGVHLLDGARLDAGGASQDFKGTVATADAGSVVLSAARGVVQQAAGAQIDVAAAAAGGQAGALEVRAQTLALDGTLAGGAARPEAGGQARIDVDRLEGFSLLNNRLNDGGFSGARELRQRQGDLLVAATDTVRARQIVLAADAGTVTLQGTLDASSVAGGGAVAVHGRSVALAAGSRIDASATSIDANTPAHGGRITVAAQDGGTLDFAQGAQMDVRSGARGDAGQVLLRAPRSANGVAATLAGQVLSQRRADSAPGQVAVEGHRVYDATGATLGQADFARYANDNLAWMATLDRAALANTLIGDAGQPQGNVHVRPAVEVRSAGNLSVIENWDLTGPGWRIANPADPTGAVEAGSLLVRAAGDLRLERAWLGNPNADLVSGPTWNIALTSGADLTAADPSRVQSVAELAAQVAAGRAGPGDLVLNSVRAEADPFAGPQFSTAASIRTGTGDIRLAAGRDFAIEARSYFDELFTGLQVFETVDAFDPFSAPLIGVVTTSGEAALTTPVPGLPEPDRFTQHGGSITIDAQRDARGAGNEWMTEWFRAVGTTDSSDRAAAGRFFSGAWWSYRPNFYDGVATFGGGDVTVRAGRDVDGLSAWAPTSARGATVAGQAVLQTWGGGNLQVAAGNDIFGGQYLVSLGEGELRAGGSVRAKPIAQHDGVVQGFRTQAFVMGAAGVGTPGGAQLQVEAGQGIALASVDNPGNLPVFNSGAPLGGPLPVSFNSAFHLNVLSYDASSGVDLQAKSGDIRVGNRPEGWWALSLFESGSQDSASSFSAPALLPPQVAMTAFDGSIVDTGVGKQILFPSTQGQLRLLAGQDIVDARFVVSDTDPQRLTLSRLSQVATEDYGGLLDPITGASNRLVVHDPVSGRYVNEVVAREGSIQSPTLSLPTVSRVQAGEDIVNFNLRLQNLDAADQTLVLAERGAVSTPTREWGISGPGWLRVQAGQDISLGTAALRSYGRTQNPALADGNGADLALIAGVRGEVDVVQLDALFQRLTQAGSEQDRAAASAAVASWLGQAVVGAGNIDSFRTLIQSNAGGDINLLAPRGNVTVGLTTSDQDNPDGVVTVAGGAIRSYLSGNFNINQGKVLTAQGGDIAIYTSEGSIDAGRGAKTSVTAPRPQRVLNEDGSVTYTFPAAVAGSGIRTAGDPAGSIFLFAPAGTIDAGEAGIASGASIFIAALTVLNADNISAVGGSTGVPVVAVGSLAATLASSGATTAAGSSKDSDSVAQAATAAAQAAQTSSFKPAILSVEVLGFGDRNCREQDRDCFAK